MPGKDFTCDLGTYQIPAYQQCEHLMSEETGDGGIILPDDRPQVSVVTLESSLVLGQEDIEVGREHPVENRRLRMSLPVDRSHTGGQM